MIVRQALFEGSVREGHEAAFRAYVADRLLPLWRRFPDVREVRVLHGIEHDPDVPEVALALSMTFDDADALARALESPVRYESRELTRGLLAMFVGSVRHHVFELAPER